MRGHEPLIAMRLRGVCPDTAWLDVGTDNLGRWRDWPRTPTSAGDLLPHIEIRPHERISGLDLRCLVGITALVSGEDEARTIRVAELCLAARAKRCFVTVHDPKTFDVISGFFYTEEVPAWQEF